MVDYEIFNAKLASIQEVNDIEIQSYLDEIVNNIIDICPIEISEECYIGFYDAVLSILIDSESIEVEKNNIINYILETIGDSEIVNSDNWLDFNGELEKFLSDLRKDIINPFKKTKKVKGAIPVDYVGKSKEDKEDKQRDGKVKAALSLASKYINRATTIDSFYYYVEKLPSSTNDDSKIVIERGIYYSTSKGSPKILTDCFINILSVSSSNPNTQDKRFTYTMEIINRFDEKFTAKLTSHELKFGKLFETLEHCKASTPPTKYLEGMLIHAVQQLAHKQDVMRQEEANELGYHKLLSGELVYLLTNGIETINGFISLDKSPLLAPSIPTYANGYEGIEVKKLDYNILKELFCKLNTNKDVQIIMLALLGLSCIVSYPTKHYEGTLPFAVEIIGENGHGKTPLLNDMLSFFGINFTWHKATLFNDTLSDGDTVKARAKMQSKMRYLMYTDMDIKQTPKHGKSFEKVYDLRNKTNAAIADNAGRMQLTITREERYVLPPNGLLVRTGNYDMAILSLQHDNIPYEKRTCTFVWPINAYINENISKYISRERIQYYTIGANYRKWCMNHTEDNLNILFDKALELAEKQIFDYQWGNDDTYKNHTITILTGLNLFTFYLKDNLATNFMINWISEYINYLIKNRIERTKYIFGSMQENLESDLVEKILTAIVVQFSSGEMYVTNQQDKVYTIRSNDIPICGLDNLGYHNNKSGKVKIGHIVNNNTTFAFIPKLLWEQLYKYGKQHNEDFKSLKYVEELLLKYKICVLDDKNEHPRHRVGTSRIRYIDIPITKIYSDIEMVDNNTDLPDNVTHIDEKRKVMEEIANSVDDLVEQLKDEVL